MIKLKRNSETDANFAGHMRYIKEGETVSLIKIKRFQYRPATIVFNVRKQHPKSHLNPFYANLNCFDHVRCEG